MTQAFRKELKKIEVNTLEQNYLRSALLLIKYKGKCKGIYTECRQCCIYSTNTCSTLRSDEKLTLAKNYIRSLI